MSFNDLETAETPKYTDFPEFETFSQAIENNLYNINNSQLASLKKLLVQYEDKAHANNTNALAAKITLLLSKTTSSFKLVNESATKLSGYLGQCERDGEDMETVQYLRQKEKILLDLVKSSIGQFQKHQKRFEVLESKNLAAATALAESFSESGAGPTPAETSGGQSIQITYEPINAEQLEEQALVVQEREREIHQISQDISEINDIFLNLHELVNEQQYQIDSIEDNILRYADDTRGATEELRRAERYQRRSSGRMVCCLAILLGVLAMIVFILVVF